MQIGLITLGCDKNTVDNEYLAGLLEDRGCAIVTEDRMDPDTMLDAVVVTTCGFIGDAKRQSVERLVEFADRKREEGNPRRLFVAGCLAQRYADELLKEIPEIDGIVGVGQFERMVELLLGTSAEKNAVNPEAKVDIYRFMRRRRLDNLPHAFLKIADGCNHACTFCSIPKMKGRFRSVAPEILLEEARGLLRQGVRELNLVAQDISVYGADLGTAYRLPELLRDLCALEGDFWIRCLYCYPGGVSDALLRVMAEEPKIVPYLDIPMQHLDPGVLAEMKRPFREIDTAGLVAHFRQAIPGLTLRTTMIVGFPGETPQAFNRLMAGIRALRFERLGVFTYSREEDTPAGNAPRQVGKATMEKRWQALMQEQSFIAEEIGQARVGTRTRVLIEGYDQDRRCFIGRSPAEAPEVDGKIFVTSEQWLSMGAFVDAEITGAETYDLLARI